MEHPEYTEDMLLDENDGGEPRQGMNVREEPLIE